MTKLEIKSNLALSLGVHVGSSRCVLRCPRASLTEYAHNSCCDALGSGGREASVGFALTGGVRETSGRVARGLSVLLMLAWHGVDR